MLAWPGRITAAALLLLLGAVASQCSPQPAKPSASRLIGDMQPVVSAKELMKYTIDPIADNIFNAVRWDVTAKGIVETRPRTDDDWDRVKTGAVTLAEGIYLLKVPRLFAPPGDVNDSIGPNAPELSPDQIKAKIEADPVLWNAKIEALRNVALEVLDVVKKKDVDALFDAGGDLDKACEDCHIEYWYPNDRKLLTAAETDKNRR
jgi:hypothetical protein